MKMIGIGLCGECGTCAPSGDNSNGPIDNQTSFTYDEGKGVKDTIVMDGPLSTVYANALNVYFAKKQIQDTEDGGLNAAFESAAIDAMVTSAMKLSEETDNDNRKTLSGLNIVSSNSDLEVPPSAVIYTVGANRDQIDSEIEVIESSFDRVKNAGKEFVVFVGPEIGTDGEVGNVYDWIDFSKVSKINAFNISDKFSRATESFFEIREIPCVVGYENLFEWLKNRKKAD